MKTSNVEKAKVALALIARLPYCEAAALVLRASIVKLRRAELRDREARRIAPGPARAAC